MAGIKDWYFAMFIESGKVKDWPGFQPKSGLKELARLHKSDFRLLPNQHLIITITPQTDLEKTKALLSRYKTNNFPFSELCLHTMACVALLARGLAMAESERYLSMMVKILKDPVETFGLCDDSVTMKMTGCPYIF